MTQTKHCMFTMFQDQTTYKTKPKRCHLANTESGAWCRCTSLGFRKNGREKAFTSKWLRPFSIQIFKGVPGSDGKFEDGIDLLIPKQNKKTRKIKGPEKGREGKPSLSILAAAPPQLRVKNPSTINSIGCESCLHRDSTPVLWRYFKEEC